MKQYVSINGQYFSKEEPYFLVNNDLFNYNDAFFELMYADGGKVHFFKEHMINVIKIMETLKMEIPLHFYDPVIFHREFEKLMHRNRLFQGNRVKFTVFRNWRSEALPTPGEINYIIDIEKVTKGGYVLNERGYLVEIVPAIPKPKNVFSNIRFCSSPYYNNARIFLNQNHLNDYFILNQDKSIIETTNSNLFILKSGTYITPALKEGCVADVMRNIVKNILIEMGHKVQEISGLGENHLLESSEAFLVNSIEGVRWIIGYNIVRYFNKTSKKLIEKLNEITKNYQENNL